MNAQRSGNEAVYALHLLYRHSYYRIAGNFRGRKLLQIVWVCGYAQKFKLLGLIQPHLTVLDYFPGASKQVCLVQLKMCLVNKTCKL